VDPAKFEGYPAREGRDDAGAVTYTEEKLGECCSTFGSYGRNVCKQTWGGDWYVGVHHGDTDGTGLFSRIGCINPTAVKYLGALGETYDIESMSNITVRVRVEALTAGKKNITLFMQLGELGDNGPATCVDELAEGGICDAAQEKKTSDAMNIANTFNQKPPNFNSAAMQAPSYLAALLLAIAFIN
jgi:hypothetical protein